MKKSSLAIVGLAAVVIAVVVFSSPKDNVQDSDYAYHVNLSESKYGEFGVYEESFEIGDVDCQDSVTTNSGLYQMVTAHKH